MSVLGDCRKKGICRPNRILPNYQNINYWPYVCLYEEAVTLSLAISQILAGNGSFCNFIWRRRFVFLWFPIFFVFYRSWNSFSTRCEIGVKILNQTFIYPSASLPKKKISVSSFFFKDQYLVFRVRFTTHMTVVHTQICSLTVHGKGQRNNVCTICNSKRGSIFG